MRVLIVDDEQPARDKLRRLLGEYSDIEEIAEAADGYQALERVAVTRPDAVFLDIQMPEISGLEVVASLPQPVPIIVFVTAFDQYAIQAFDANAIDYLLKPYDQARLQRSVQRIRERLKLAVASSANPDGELESSSDNAKVALPSIRQLLISERGVTRVIKVDQIEWLETADNYVILHCADSHPMLRQTLTALLESVGPEFVRCHRRTAVRRECVERVIAQDKGDGELLMRSGDKVPYSRQYRAAVVAAIA